MAPFVMTLLTSLFACALASDPVFLEGVRLRNAFEYEQSLQTFERALQADEPRTAEERAILLMYTAVLHAELHRFDDARERFAAALDEHSGAELTLDVSPTIRALFEEVKAARARQPEPASPDAADLAPEGSSSSGTSRAPAEPSPPGEEPSPVAVLGVGAASVGAALAVGGAAVWALGVGAYLDAEQAPFQSDTVAKNQNAATLQLVGQVMAGAGLAVAVLGVTLLLVE